MVIVRTAFEELGEAFCGNVSLEYVGFWKRSSYCLPSCFQVEMYVKSLDRRFFLSFLMASRTEYFFPILQFFFGPNWAL